VSALNLPSSHLYEKLAGEVAGQIQSGVFRPGDRLPSVRHISRQKQLSISTVLQAYQTLEDRGVIEARPQSGYYVRYQRQASAALSEPRASTRGLKPEAVNLGDLTRRVLDDASQPGLVQFGAALPAAELLPGVRLNNLLARQARSGRVLPHQMGTAQGCPELRIQAARRAFLAGASLDPDGLIVTNGCTEALHLALRAVCSPGDLVAIESPTYFGILQVLESLGLHALEIPCHPRQGMRLDILQSCLERFTVRAVVAVTNFSNPLGCCMPDEHKHQMVEMLSRLQIPLIEDDIYGELAFGERRPLVARSFDLNGNVILCCSFSKSLALGFRVGWMDAGRWTEEVKRLKIATSLFSPLLPQLALAEFLETGGYDHALRRMRRTYAMRTAQMGASVLRHFPAGTRVSSPDGGFVIWVQLPEEVDSLDLYKEGLSSGITLAPGYLFAPGARYRHYIRLNAAIMSIETEWAVQRLGMLAGKLMSRQENR